MHYLKAFILFAYMLFAYALFASHGEIWAYSVPAVETRQRSASVGAIHAQYGKKIELGKWYTNFQVCKDFSDQTGVPCLFIYENYNCGNCWHTMYEALLTDKFREFQNGAGKIIYCYLNGNVNKFASNDKYKDEYVKQMEISSWSQPAYAFMKAAGSTWPYVVLYNPKTGKKNTAQGAGFAAIYTGKVYIYKPEAAITWLTQRLVGFAPTASVPLPVDPASTSAEPETVFKQFISTGYPRTGMGAPYGYNSSSVGAGDESFQWCLDLVRTNMVKPKVTSPAARRRPLIIICGKDNCGTCSSFANMVNNNLRGMPPWFGRFKITTAYFRGKDNGTAPAACAHARAFVKEKFGAAVEPCHRIYVYGVYEDGTEYLGNAGNVPIDPNAYGTAILAQITHFDNDYDKHLMTQFQRDTNRLRELQTNAWSVFKPCTIGAATKILKMVNPAELANRGTNIIFSLPAVHTINNEIVIIDNNNKILKYLHADDVCKYTISDSIIYEWQAHPYFQYSFTNSVQRNKAVEVEYIQYVYRIADALNADTVKQDMAWKAPDKYTQCSLSTNEIYAMAYTADVAFTNTWIDASGKHVYEPFVIQNVPVTPKRNTKIIGRVFTRYTEDAISSK